MASKHKSEVHEMRLEPLDGQSGVISHTTHKLARGGQGGGPDYDYDTEKIHHPTLKHLTSHIAETMGQHFGKESAAEERNEAKAEGGEE